MIKNKRHFIKMNVIMAVILIVVIILNMVATYWGEALTQFMGYLGDEHSSASETVYTSSYSDEELVEEQEALSHQTAVEGTILLKNTDNTLPLASGSNVTIFNEASTEWMINGTGSSAMGTEDYLYVTVKWSLENAGLNVNETVWDWYLNNGVERGGASSDGDWSINESSWDTVTDAVGGASAYEGYQDAAIVVIGRAGGEGADLPTSMENYGGSAEESYLDLTQEERSILENVKENGFEKLIVVINTANALALDWINDYDIDAILWLGPTGAYGLEALGQVLVGNENPSGHMTDTGVYDEFSSAAMQNFGDTRYVDENGEAYGSSYNYVSYNEGIYVGYRYYETRYEDYVMGTANVGDYIYEETVAFPFGYGLSYTTFEWSNYTQTESDGQITVSVDVTNTGSVAGKDVVQIYFQSPYTDYDKANAVEKASVELIGFAKTQDLEPGETETVTVSFDITDMKSYDYTTAKTYIMDEGNYYVTAGTDVHNAVNNILVAKGYDVSGDSNLVGVYVQDEFTVLDTDETTGVTVTNLFDDVSADDAQYLTRQNWSMMDDNGLAYSDETVEINGTVYAAHYASEELISSIDTKSWELSGRPSEADDYSEVTVDTDHGLELIDLMGKDYDDSDWDLLLEELKMSEMHTMWNKGGYTAGGTVESINKPLGSSTDGPAGLAMFMSGWGCFCYNTEFVLACTWNDELAEKLGELVGEDALKSNITGWFAPAMNLHRTPFGGRCFEYYSEDPYLSGVMASNTVSGARSKGMITYIKHFALNEQETNRNSVSTWSNEQTMRELYFQPFEMAVKDGGSNGVMTSYNNIGYRDAKGSYALVTSLLKTEWGFQGIVITDLATESGTGADMSLAAGVDVQLTTGINELSTTHDNRVRNALIVAAHNVLYTLVNSSAMNGVESGVSVSNAMPVYILILVIVDVLCAILLVVAELRLIKKCRQEPVELTEEQKKARRKKIIIISVATAVVLIAVIVGILMYISSMMIGESVFEYIFRH